MVVLIVASEQSVVVEDVPDRVVDLLEANGLAVECLRKELLTRVQAEAASVADATQFDVSRVARRGDARRVSAARRLPAGCRRLVAERFVRPDVIVGATKVVEDALLQVEVGSRRPWQTLLERAVHAFVSRILLRLTWRDALVRDAELKPPDIEMGQAVDAGRGEGGAVVAADGIGKPVPAEEGAELGLHARRTDVEQPVAREQVAAEVVDDREGIAVAPVAHAELPFEVDGPDLIGSRRAEGSGPGVLPPCAPAAGMNAAVAQQDVADRAAGGPGLIGIPLEETLTDFASAPTVTAVLLQDQLHEFGRRRGWRGSRRTAVVEKKGDAALLVTVEPLVPGDAADAVTQAQLAHPPVAALSVVDEVSPLKHGVGLLPWHRASSQRGKALLTMSPDTCKLCLWVVPRRRPTRG